MQFVQLPQPPSCYFSKIYLFIFTSTLHVFLDSQELMAWPKQPDPTTSKLRKLNKGIEVTSKIKIPLSKFTVDVAHFDRWTIVLFIHLPVVNENPLCSRAITLG